MSPIAEGIQQSENKIIFACKRVQKWLCNFQHPQRLATNVILLCQLFEKNE